EYIPATLNTPAIIAMGFELLNPVSEGSVNIQSDNSFQLAAADDGFYLNPIDLQNMKNAVQTYIRDMINTLATFDPPYYQPILTAPINLVMLQGYSDNAVTQYVKNNSNLSLDVHHFVGHCKMASLNA